MERVALTRNAVAGHPAVQTWMRLSGGPPPESIEVLKENSKAGAYRLLGVGRDGQAVIAKRRRVTGGTVERTVLERVLPGMSTPALAYYGTIAFDDWTWLFTEDARGVSYDPANSEHIRLAAMWLADLHVRGAAMPVGILPDRGADHYREQLRHAISTIEAHSRNPVLSQDSIEKLDRVVGFCQQIEGEWSRIERAAAEGPSTIVHGDFTAKNLRVRTGRGDATLVTFDWEMAGAGPAGVDLAHFLNAASGDALSLYLERASELWDTRTLADVERAATVGCLFRSISSLAWMSGSLRLRKAEKYVVHMERFGNEVKRRGREVLEGEMQIIRSRFPDGKLLVHGLGQALGTPEDQIEITHREPNLFRSSFPSELVFCRAGKRELKLLCKYGAGHAESGFGHRGGVAYETDVYRHVLGPLPLSRPQFHGEWTDPATGEPWLAIEYVEGALRTDAAEPVPDPLTIVGRWLGGFHRWCEAQLGSDELAFVKRYDQRYYMSWAQRTSEYAGHHHERFPQLRTLCERFDSCIEVLMSGAQTVVHGEFTPHNVLIKEGFVYPIDWESAAIGPGEIDLASLTDRWPPLMVKACLHAYIAARWLGNAPPAFERVLTAARLYWSLRWLGNKPEWTQREKSAKRFQQVQELGEELGII